MIGIEVFGNACLRLLLFIVAGSVTAIGQTGSILGKVVYAESGAISAKRVLTAEAASGVQREATADREGRFTLSPVAPGKYTLKIRSQGFVTRTISNIVVATGGPNDLGTIVLDTAGCFAPGVNCDYFGPAPITVHAEAKPVVSSDCGVDVDEGKRTCGASDFASDFRIRLSANGDAYLVPGNGALVAVDTHGRWSLEDCIAGGYSAEEVRVDNLDVDSRACVQSNKGRYAEVFGFSRSELPPGVVVTFITWPGRSDLQ